MKNDSEQDITKNYLNLLCAMVRLATIDAGQHQRFRPSNRSAKQKRDAEEFLEWCRGNLV